MAACTCDKNPPVHDDIVHDCFKRGIFRIIYNNILTVVSECRSSLGLLGTL